MSETVLYRETLSSPRTTALFIALVILFGALTLWQIDTGGQAVLKAVFAVLALVFLFYVINYRKLLIRLTTQELVLSFGIFSRTIPIDTIQDCRLDDPPWFFKYGGAGIHFYSLRGLYRASFNFLEFPRVAIILRRNAGLVKEISFTTRQPHTLIDLIRQEWTQA